MKYEIFEKIKQYYDEDNLEREKIIQDSRKINALSKKVIYSLHRDDLDNAKKNMDNLNKELIQFLKLYSKSKHSIIGSYKVAIQEFIEAISFYYFVKNEVLYQPEFVNSLNQLDSKFNNQNLNNPICISLSEHKFMIDPDFYILGLCDLSGELVRKALNDGIKGDYASVFKIQKFLSSIFNEVAQIDYRNGEIRKKFDSLRWDLRKIEEMAFSLKIKQKG